MFRTGAMLQIREKMKKARVRVGVAGGHGGDERDWGSLLDSNQVDLR